MKLKITFLLLLVTTFFYSCSDDDDVTPTSDIVGEWTLVSLEYSGISSTEYSGQTYELSYKGTGTDMDYTTEFKDDNTYSSGGSYTILLETEGAPDTEWTNPGFFGSGSFEINGNTMTVEAEGMEGEQTANIVELDDHNLELNLTGRVNLSYAWTDINITFKYTR
ncbi:hypothetical protein [Chondrinema litorale]|uniref:hypothetical protein n=1 Tax=Chondrinema litorale TaxID=2994555 RepID=UPI00254310A2|nr:hypothetical protein [Chondrinema litorale]UZR98343.1 hypothetical protein OQ292_30560 [Chondrinema litorale]